MAEYRRFIKTDWYAYGGATQFSETQDPFIYERKIEDGVEMLIIVDKKGIEIDFGKEDSDEEIGYYKEIELNSIRAEGELKHLIAYLSKFDSAPDIAYSLDHPDNDVTKGFEAY